MTRMFRSALMAAEVAALMAAAAPVATAPRLTPGPGTGAGSSADTPTGSVPDRAAQRAQMESLVTAARAAAERGNEQQCMDSLSKARALTERGRGTGGGG